MENGYSVSSPIIDCNGVSLLKKIGKTNGHKKYPEIFEDELNLNQWKKPPVDFETMAVSETIGESDRVSGTFSRNSLVMPIVTSVLYYSVLFLHFVCNGMLFYSNLKI